MSEGLAVLGSDWAAWQEHVLHPSGRSALVSQPGVLGRGPEEWAAAGVLPLVWRSTSSKSSGLSRRARGGLRVLTQAARSLLRE